MAGGGPGGAGPWRMSARTGHTNPKRKRGGAGEKRGEAGRSEDRRGGATTGEEWDATRSLPRWRFGLVWGFHASLALRVSVGEGE